MPTEQTVCTNMTEFVSNHKKALKAIEFLRQQSPDDYENMIDSIEYLINDMLDNATEMHKGATCMEERLRLYRSAIESLGFTRTKEN
jgi:hypothetical protein